MKESNQKKKLNIPLLIVSAVVSILLWVLVLPYLHDSLIDHMAGPLAVAIVFSVFLVALAVTVLCISSLTGAFRADILTGYTEKRRIPLYILLAAAVGFALAAGAEFLYETDIDVNTVPKTPDTYIFVVDDSGTMCGNDPADQRFRAIEYFIHEKPESCRYAVYTFASDVSLILPMTSSGTVTGTLQGRSSGTTNIKAALTQVLDDYDAGVWTPGSNTMVILITDGKATDILNVGQISGLLNRFTTLNIPVSTVGLGDADLDLITHIANTTGGQMVDIQNVADMGHAFHTVTSVRRLNQTLFTDRSSLSYQPLYGIIRVLAITLLGTLLGAICVVCYGVPREFAFILKLSIAKSALAGAVLELGICGLDLPPHLACILAGMLLGTVFARIVPLNQDPFNEVSSSRKPLHDTGMGFDL